MTNSVYLHSSRVDLGICEKTNIRPSELLANHSYRTSKDKIYNRFVIESALELSKTYISFVYSHKKTTRSSTIHSQYKTQAQRVPWFLLLCFRMSQLLLMRQ